MVKRYLSTKFALHLLGEFLINGFYGWTTYAHVTDSRPA